MVNAKTKKILNKKRYSVVGNHSAVQACRWTKKSLIGEGVCYKEQFYGIKSHECCQMSPWISCMNQCIHCWRPIELDFDLKLNPKERGVDDVKEIISGCIKEQKRLLSGCKGDKRINLNKLEEAKNPKQFAISLIGEPTIYPKIGKLISELRRQGKSTFLVTNGLLPERLKELGKKKQLPTQLYISLNSPNREEYEKWQKSKFKDAWKKFNQTLELFPKLNTRKIIRMTLIRDLNMREEFLPEFSKLILKADPDFIEVKGYMAVGDARERCGYKTMPTHKEIQEFSQKLSKELGKEWKILDEKLESRVVLVGKEKKRRRIKKEEI